MVPSTWQRAAPLSVRRPISMATLERGGVTVAGVVVRQQSRSAGRSSNPFHYRIHTSEVRERSGAASRVRDYRQPLLYAPITSRVSYDPNVQVDTHYAEASLMPVLVNKLVFRIVPERAPFLLRPLLRGVFSMLTTRMVDPRLKLHATMVSPYTFGEFQSTFDRSI